MSFFTNPSQQMILDDSTLYLTPRERKALENSWSKAFSDDLFPLIDEEPFSVLYCTDNAAPNTPINVLVGASIIKELMGYSDDDIVEGLMLDVRLQYALYTTSFKEQPLYAKSLQRFRKRCYEYELETGNDLMHTCIVALSREIAKVMNISGRTRCMDSMMIDANIKKLSRLELIYTCIADLVIRLKKNPWKGFQKICSTIRLRTTSPSAAAFPSRRSKRKAAGGSPRMRTGYEFAILQNSSDLEATFRCKAGEEHRDYVANMEESIGENGLVITDYQFEQNTYRDSQFLEDTLKAMEPSEEPVVIATDGAYPTPSNQKLAKEKNVRIISTNMPGKKANDFYADFGLSEDEKTILACPGGIEPTSYSGPYKNSQMRVTFASACCACCPYRE